MKIAEYLDRTYPDTPRAIPAGTAAFHRIFEEQASSLLLHILPNYALATAALLNPISEGFFRRNIEEMEGRKLEEMAPEGDSGPLLAGRPPLNFLHRS
jgi:hypothetical protein